MFGLYPTIFRFLQIAWNLLVGFIALFIVVATLEMFWGGLKFTFRKLFGL